ncbi:hypothetical protein N7447_001587, partial [Penicillium robsamsonii]|uniref:uncharacterized protein n=1 Tax=Penicillium robsamsonii TaxID=1792511 RepID=UPI002549B1E6
AAAIPLLNRHRFLFFPLSPFLPQSILTPFAFVGLFDFFLTTVVWTSLGLEISLRVIVKKSHWNGWAAREYILLFSAYSSLVHAN